MYKTFFALLGLVLTTSILQAENGQSQFNLKKGLTLIYRTEQTSRVQQVVGELTTVLKNHMILTKQWTVTDVNKQGVAKLEMSLKSLRLVTTLPSGETLMFDSQQLEKSDAQLRPQMEKFVQGILAVLEINAQGQIISAKAAKHFPASWYKKELPFVLELPKAKIEVGSKWARKYQVTLEPPHGTGEKFDATQQYTCKGISNNKATITFQTTIKDLPKAKLDQIPLFQSQPDGEVLFDLKTGRMLKANYRILKTLKNHQGTDSSYQFESTYEEQLLSAKE